jgi:hypothetical protein
MLAAFEPGARHLHFVQTTRSVLLEAAFIDGRTPLSPTGRHAVIPLEDAVAWLPDDPAMHAPDRFVAHVGFCCSTLLTRVLDATGVSLAYREPQVFTDICMLKTTRHDVFADAAAWRGLLAVVKSQFRKRFGMTHSLVKLSNWPVNLLPDLLSDSVSARAIFITSDRRDYLVAILRGGVDRSAFMLKFVQKLRLDYPVVEVAVREVETARDVSKLQRVLRCALIALALQEHVFARLMQTLPKGCGSNLRGAALLDRTGEVLSEIGATLALPIDGEECSDAVRGAFVPSAKQPGSMFDPRTQEAENARVHEAFGAEIEGALYWAENGGIGTWPH